MRKKRAVLFDLDGVLVQTEPLKARAHVETVHQFGGSVSPALYLQLVGQPHKAVRAAFMAAGGIDVDSELYTRRYRRIYRGLLETELETTPGMVDLVRNLADIGFSLAVVSSSPSETVAQILEHTSLSSFFPERVRVAVDHVAKPKPAPDPYECALRLLGVKPTSAIAIEDSKAGITSARTAELRVLALHHAYNVGQDLSQADRLLGVPVETKAVMEILDSLLDS